MALNVQSIAAEIQEVASHLDEPRLTARLDRILDVIHAEADRCSPETMAAFDEILKRLSDIASVTARAAIAERVSDLKSGPQGIVSKLAWDEAIEVAEPVLKRSPLLGKDELFALAQRRGNAHLLAISQRVSLAPEIVEVLVERGNQAVVAAIARSRSAAMSEASIVKLRERRKEHKREKRSAVRVHVRYPAHFRMSPEGDAMPCTVLDISLSGARLGTREPIRLPDRIYLTMSTKAGLQRLSEVVWQDGTEFGVRFLSSRRILSQG
jgi:Uncharacterised protein conserved in bacteria (DUF2336)/PilZ domain